MSVNIYVLKLEENKYYVGQTKNIVKRFERHRQQKAARFTKKYKAKGIVELMESNASDFKELCVTLDYMQRHGIQNVRGGPFSKVEHTADDIRCIVRILRSNSFPEPWKPHESDLALLSHTSEDDAESLQDK